MKDNGEQRAYSLQERASMVNIDVEAQTCPVCDWAFSKNLTLEGKQQHIEEHFAQ